MDAVTQATSSDPSALHVVLQQEVERYNALLNNVRRSCAEVQRGLKGLVVMSADLDDIANALFNAKVRALKQGIGVFDLVGFYFLGPLGPGWDPGPGTLKETIGRFTQT